MHHKKPIYVTRCDTALAVDVIRPYGERLTIASESKRKETAWKLLKGPDAELYPKPNKGNDKNNGDSKSNN